MNTFSVLLAIIAAVEALNPCMQNFAERRLRMIRPTAAPAAATTPATTARPMNTLTHDEERVIQILSVFMP